MTALYRKYRPQDFDDVVGQEPVVRTLKNAIAAGQVRARAFDWHESVGALADVYRRAAAP